MVKKLVIYSSASGGTVVQKKTESLKNMLIAKKADYQVVYLDVDPTDKEMVWNKSGKKGVYPMLFADGEYIGTWEEVEEFNELELLDQKIGTL